ncbi:MAG: FG-GAP-like repeat-containing protein [Anaerolineae bacterium]|nr:FG-GAP-like repeat-containing protein [Anaerolineae bacterium]
MKSRRAILNLGIAVAAGTVLMSLVVSIGHAASLAKPLLVPGNPIVAPPANAYAAPPTTTISVIYDEGLDPATVSTRTFAVHAMQTGLLTEALGVDGATISLTPTQPLKPGELVQVSATTGTLNLIGEGPVAPTVWQFWAAVGTGSSATFQDSGQRLGSSQTQVVALGDLDGDGDLDAFTGNGGTAYNQANHVWLNMGGAQAGAPGILVNSGQALGLSKTTAVKLGDVDGDGDLDAFVGNSEQANAVWLNNGTGTFGDSAQSLGSAATTSVALGDLDGDSDLDAFVGNSGAPDEVWLNDGNGAFVDSGQSLGVNENTSTVVLGDLDGDGDLDALITFDFSHVGEVWLNDGTGLFTISLQNLAYYAYAAVLGDVNGDGDLDALVGYLYAADRVWLNNGAGTLVDSGQRLGDAISTLDVALGDVDGDGDLDAFTGSSGADRVWLNGGTGVFTDSGQSLSDVGSRSVALGDLDGDGDLDALVGNWESNQVWINDMRDLIVESFLPESRFLDLNQSFSVTVTVKNQGAGDVTTSFDTAVYSDHVPAPCDGGVGSWASQATVSLTAGNSVTLAFTHPGFGSAGQHTLYALADTACAVDSNPANNTFGPLPVWVDPFTVTATIPPGNGLQITHDGVISATFSEDVNSSTVSTRTFTIRGQQTGVYAGDYAVGSVTFDAASDFKPGEEIVVNLSDSLQSTDGGLLVPYAWQFRTEVTAGTGIFSDSFQVLNADNTYVVALGDMDADGDLDVLSVGYTNTLWLNQGGIQGGILGAFADSGQIFENWSEAAALGDLDGDGDLDAFIAHGSVYGGAPNQVWLNDGTGVLTDSGQSLGNEGTLTMALGDVDGDGDLDVFLGNNGSSQVWSNDGSGVFTDTGQNLGSSETQAVVLGDVDGDGDIDAITGNWAQADRLWLNDGTGTFVQSDQDLGSGSTFGVALGDVDEDGDLDLLFGYTSATGNQVWLNNNGAFTDSGQRLGSLGTYAVTLGDVDGDGDLDALFGHGMDDTNDPNRVWLNQGGAQGGTIGVFADSGQHLGSEDTNAVALGDVDGDGDLDAVFGNYSQADSVWLNNKNHPVPKDDAWSVPANVSGYPLGVLDNDSDPDGDALEIVAVGTPDQGGTAVISATQISYTSLTGFVGMEVFTYTISDPGGLTGTAVVTMDVGGINNPPQAEDDTAATNEDTPVSISVLSNDSDPDGHTLSILAVGTPSIGGATIAGSQVAYAPTPQLSGTDVFTYVVSDGWLTDTANITVTVTAVEDPPTLDTIPDQTIAEDSGTHTLTLSNITSGAFNENQPLTVTAHTAVNPGIIPDPTVTYTSPNTTGTLRFAPLADQFGNVRVDVTVDDGAGQTTRSFWIAVNAVNDPPTVDLISDRLIDEDSGSHGVGVTGIDAGPSSETGQRPNLAMSASSMDTSLIQHPTVSYDPVIYWSGSLTFSPVADRFGTTTIEVTVTDGISATVRSFQVTVNPIDDPPTLDAISNVTTNEDASVQTVPLSGIGSGSIYENQTLVVTATSGDTTLIPDPVVIYTSPNTTGSLSFTPVADRFGTTTMVVTVTDGLSTTARTFQVSVNPVNDPPTLDAIPDVEIPNRVGPPMVDINGIGAGPYETQPLTVTASSSDLTMLANPQVLYASPDPTGRLRLMPVPYQYGSVTVVVTVADGLLTANRSFVVTLIEPFWVVSTAPPNGSSIAPTGIISANFNRTVDGSTVRAGSFTVRGPQTGAYDGSYTVGSVVQFDATNPFKPGEHIEVSLTGDIRSTAAEMLIPYTWQFRTAVSAGTGTFVDSGQSPGYYGDIPLEMELMAPQSVLDSQAVALGDLDGDGDLDAYVVKNGIYATVWKNQAGIYVPSGQQLGQASSWAVALGDLDGDGDLDAFVGNYGAGNTVWLNNGVGMFTNSGQSLGSADTFAVALGDVDGDGDLDAVVGNDIGQGSRVWLNDGTSTFNGGQTLSFGDTRAVALGDLDNDGDLDVYLAHSGDRPNEVWLNNGGAQWGVLGEFVNSGQSLGRSDTYAVALGDLDGDGDLDAYVGNGSGQADEVWRNNGSGVFSNSGQRLGGRAAWAVALGDVDADGDLDAFVANVGYGDVTTRANQVWRNNGTGTFSNIGQNLGNEDSLSVALGDIDGDGDLDAFVGNSNGLYQTNKLYLNQPNAPMVAGDIFYVPLDAQEAPLDVLVNDWDPDGDAIAISSVSAPVHGAAVSTGSAVLYTPKTGFVGQDAFTYTVSDSGGLSGEVQVAVRVLALTQSIIADAARGGSLFYVDAQDSAIIVDVPPGAVSVPTEFRYTSEKNAPAVPGGFLFAGKAFDLDTYQDGAFIPGISLSAPLTITIHYTDADLFGLIESSLELRTWNGFLWTDDGITVVSLDPVINRVVVTVNHLSSFALFGQGERYTVYLPLAIYHQSQLGLQELKLYQTLGYRAE